MENTVAERRSSGFVLWHGILGGLIVGIIFFAYQMIAGAMYYGDPYYYPTVLASLVIDVPVIGPFTALNGDMAISILMALIPSAVLGVLFLGLLTSFRRTCSATWRLFAYGGVFGVALWVLADWVLGFTVFPQLFLANQFWMGFLPFTVLIGMGLSLYVSLVRYAPQGALNPSPQVCYAGTAA